MTKKDKLPEDASGKGVGSIGGELYRLDDLLAQLRKTNAVLESSLEFVLRSEEKEVRELPDDNDNSSYILRQLTFFCNFLENEINNERAIIARIEL
jgi:hypothetical protein